MRSWLSRVLLLAAVLLALSPAGEAATRDLLPGSGEVLGWIQREAPRTYQPANLYEHINGAADLFLAYGFQEVAVADFVPQRADEGWITVDIYDMGTALHAFGICTSEVPPGAESLPSRPYGYSADGVIGLWRSRYYVKVALIDGDDGEAARLLAEAAAARIGGEDRMPAELARLPVDNRVPASESYVKKGALGHRFLNEVVSATYRLDETGARLYVADLGAPETAAEGLQKLREFEISAKADLAALEGVGEGGFATLDPYYGEMAAVRQGQFLALAISEKAERSDLTALVTRTLPLLVTKAGNCCKD